MEELRWLVSLPMLLIIGVLGMFTHFLKKEIKGETVTDIAAYFADHFKSTFIALVTTLLGVLTYYLTLATGQPADVVTVFLSGYMFDSVLNKWEAKAP